MLNGNFYWVENRCVNHKTNCWQKMHLQAERKEERKNKEKKEE